MQGQKEALARSRSWRRNSACASGVCAVRSEAEQMWEWEVPLGSRVNETGLCQVRCIGQSSPECDAGRTGDALYARDRFEISRVPGQVLDDHGRVGGERLRALDVVRDVQTA